ncbi:hypothetical protein Tco_0117630 [Tanacetum coccineum]
MANLSEDIQCAGSDTRPPMLDKADFASWQQRIRLYCRGKDNGVNILKSIDEGPFQMGTTPTLLKELKSSMSNRTEDRVKFNGVQEQLVFYGEAQNRVGNANPGQARQDKDNYEDVDEKTSTSPSSQCG